MNDKTTCPIPEGGEAGYSIEHILLSVTVVHTNSIMQYDDSCAHILRKALREYEGVERIEATVHYDHTKTDVHVKRCECGFCCPQNDPPKTSCPEKPPLGVKPDYIHRQERMNDLAAGINRYLDAGKGVHSVWLYEFLDLYSKMQKL